jgi:hypothetical protein
MILDNDRRRRDGKTDYSDSEDPGYFSPYSGWAAGRTSEESSIPAKSNRFISSSNRTERILYPASLLFNALRGSLLGSKAVGA